MERKRLLQFPGAAEGIHFEDAYRHRGIVSALEEVFFRWGYLPVETPAFDFFDIYRPLLHGRDIEKVYRLIDREGDLLMLRSDITLFLAKQVGLALKVEDLPIRACYSGVVLRHQNQEDISSNEFFQVGAELIGKPGMEGDLEILFLALTALDTLEVSARIHLGSRSFFHSITGGWNEKKQKALGAAIYSRDRDAMLSILETVKTPEIARVLTNLFLFIGTIEEYASLLQDPHTDKLEENSMNELRYLAGLAEILDEAGAASRVRIDLSEIGAQPYYTGIVFQGYMEHLDSAFLGGGRYDELLSTFGLDAASVGFSFFPRKIEPWIGHPERFSLGSGVEQAQGASFLEKYHYADAARRRGKRVVL